MIPRLSPHSARKFSSLIVTLLAVAAWPSFALAQAVPAERPRNRPPSMLTGRAQWEKGADMLKAMNVPPARRSRRRKR
jgi:hypothetical protein